MIKAIGLKIGLVSVSICAMALVAAAQQSAAPVAAVQELPALPDASISAAIKNAVNSPDRPAADKELDAGRKPEQMLAFFGIAPGMQVADLFAGGGYTTELLSRVVGPNGKVYSQNIPFPEKFKKVGDTWDARLKKPALKNVVRIQKPFDAPDLLPVPPNSLDAVVMNMNYHDLVLFKFDRANVNAAVFKALKPGGFYDIVDHSAKNGSGIQDVSLHRIDEKFLIDEVEKSGFKLAAASSALRHPDDDRTWNVFKKRGQTDRFMLKFVKPQ
jgi:predicted methyltransferase